MRLNVNDDQDVEWGYAFDVHLNAFFPPLIILHGCQLFFYNGLISHEWFASRLLGNTFWLVAVVYYTYITFLGYSCKYNITIQICNTQHCHLSKYLTL